MKFLNVSHMLIASKGGHLGASQTPPLSKTKSSTYERSCHEHIYSIEYAYINRVLI